MLADDERTRIMLGCARWLSGHERPSMRDWLAGLAARPDADGPADVYGTGEVVQELERRVADLLGKPSARFVIKGVIAQQAALRAWADDRGRRGVVLHPLSHLDLDEANAVERLHPMHAIRLGTTQPFGVRELETVTEPIGVVSIELPLRRAGFALPTWDELAAISAWCREQGVPLHLDGARLWESQPYYARPLDEIAALADSVYVSFYKGLGGLAGCVLAGSEALVAKATPWMSRLGANVYASFPYVLSALAGLDHHLPLMAGHVARAQRLAAAIGAVPGVRVTEPRTNAFAVYLPGDPDSLDRARAVVAERSGVWLFTGFSASPVPGYTLTEVSVGSATAAVSDGEAAALTAELLALAATPPAR